MDTLAGYVAYTLREPRIIDFEAIEGAAEDAGYTIVELKLEFEGEIQRVSDGIWLEVSPTGQRFRLQEPVRHEGRMRVRTEASGWKDGDVRLRLIGHEATAP